MEIYRILWITMGYQYSRPWIDDMIFLIEIYSCKINSPGTSGMNLEQVSSICKRSDIVISDLICDLIMIISSIYFFFDNVLARAVESFYNHSITTEKKERKYFGNIIRH